MKDLSISSLEAFGYKQELKRTLKFKDLVIFGMVFMSPVSCMTLFGLLNGISRGHAVLAYLVGFCAMLFTAYSYGKMARAFPVAGSTYSYTQRAIHPYLGFIAGWVMLLDYVLIPLLLYVISANFACALFPQIPYWVWVLIFIIPVTIVNLLGIDVAAKVNNAMTMLMLLGVFCFIALAIINLTDGGLTKSLLLNGVYNPETFSFKPLISASAIAVLSYLGFDAITTLSEEVNGSGSKVGAAAILACIFQTIIYISVVYFAVLTVPDFMSLDNPDTAFFNVAHVVGGVTFQTLITLIIMVSGIATALAGQSAAARLLYGMGRDKMIPASYFAWLHPKYLTPSYSIIFMALLGAIGSFTLRLETISELVTFGALFGFICVNLSVIVHYWIKIKGSTKLQYLLFPSIGTIVCVYIWINLSPLSKTVGFTWMALGIIYLGVKSRGFKAVSSLFNNHKM